MKFYNLITRSIVLVLTTFLLISCGSSENNNVDSGYSDLTEEQKYALSYMWHEEKLAYDIYVTLDANTPSNQLSNIANRSETKHIGLVQDLVEKYNLDITNATDYENGYSEEILESMPIGEYKIAKIQDLYNILYDKGINSLQDALEVGCMVEVTDIDDLDKYLEISKGAQDLIDTFTILIEGSYKHYWAFDSGLKNLGIENGCCSLGVINGVDYCHDEYPRD